jgi:murein DD-endopeptidase MepM/ murein hydrolase activator NlpD
MKKLRIWYSLFILLTLILNLFIFNATAFAADSPSQSEPAPNRATPGVLYFAQTGHYLSGKFRQYWESTGGLAQYGYPLTREFTERNPDDGNLYTVQYFERNRFEYHPELAGTPYEVQLGLLGKQYTLGRTFTKSPPFVDTASRRYFSETGHSLSYAFLTYWNTRGGLAIYGYPTSEEIIEKGYTVQYFERARFEYHPENKGTPYEVQLGLLGSWALERAGYSLPQVFSLSVEPDTITQGKVASVTLNNGLYGKNARGSFGGAPLNFAESGNGRLRALAPAPSNAELKTRPLNVEVTDDTGVVRRFDEALSVRSGNYPSQVLYVTPDVVAPADVARREENRLNEIFSRVTPEKYWLGNFAQPAFGPITTEYGTRRTYTGGTSDFRIHDGIDIGAPARTPIRASANGRVVLSELQQVRGNIVILDHGLGVFSLYFHNERNLVKVGDFVKQGDTIALVGTTGLSTGPHLHWEVRVGKIGVDPMEWVRKGF